MNTCRKAPSYLFDGILDSQLANYENNDLEFLAYLDENEMPDATPPLGGGRYMRNVLPGFSRHQWV